MEIRSHGMKKRGTKSRTEKIGKEFPKSTLQELVYEAEINGCKKISNEISGTSRWSTIYEMIFQHENKFYKSDYSVAATESQDESPYEYEGDDIFCEEVIPVKKTITVYEPVQK